MASLRDAFGEMQQQARATLIREFGAGETFFERHAEMRYSGQRHNIKVPISGMADVADIRANHETKDVLGIDALGMNAASKQRGEAQGCCPERSCTN